MLKQVLFARFDPVVTHFGPWKILKCFERGPFWDQKLVKNVFFQKRYWTIWDSQTSVFSPC